MPRNKSTGNPPEAADVLKDRKAVQKVLSSPEAKKLLNHLQTQNTTQLQSAAKAALSGDPSALSSLLENLSHNPDTAKAIQHLNDRISRQ